MARTPSAEMMKGLTTATNSDKGFLGDMLDNPIFGAGVGVAGLGLGLTLLRRGAMSGLLVAQRYFTTSLEIPSKDRSYHWVLNWINHHTQGRTQHIGVETRVTVHDNGSHSTSFDFVPAPGRHFIWFKRNLIQVEREREKSMIDLNSGSPWETVKLTHFGRNREVFNELLDEARQLAARKEEGKVVVYMPMMTDWRPFGRPRPKRPLSSVILDEGLAEHLESDIKEFHRAAKWYNDRGIPHRRGYLLYGPPGSGKTSFIQALAGDMGHNICVLNLNDRGLTDDRLLHLMTEVPPRSFVLLEDIDAVFNKRETAYSVTFSGLLNALDGVTSAEERIVFMTTNHIERLDPALIRPGRVDCKVYVGNSTPYQQRAMFMQFYPEFTSSAAEELIAGRVAVPNVGGATQRLPRGFEDTRATMQEDLKEGASDAGAAEPVVVKSMAAAVDESKENKENKEATAGEEEDVLKIGATPKEYNFKYKRGQHKIMQQQYIESDEEREATEAFFDFAEEDQASNKSEIAKLADEFVAALDGVDVSMAELQGLLMVYKDQPRGCIRAALVLREQKVQEREQGKEHLLQYQKFLQEQAQAKIPKDL